MKVYNCMSLLSFFQCPHKHFISSRYFLEFSKNYISRKCFKLTVHIGEGLYGVILPLRVFAGVKLMLEGCVDACPCFMDYSNHLLHS